MPKISVIMPAYNAEKYIAEAIDSILAQTYRDFEFIILNDCSKDRTEEIILSYTDPRIVYLKNEKNMGVAATLNRGLSVAKGEYIARMDADDISLPMRFEKQVAYLDENPKIAVLGCNVECFEGGKILSTGGSSSDPVQMRVDMFFACGLAHPGVMTRRAVIGELGGYDPEFEGLEDYELWCRVQENWQVVSLLEVLLRYRIHGGQVTKNPSERFVQRMHRLKQRQLQQLELPQDTPEAQAFYAHCTGKAERNEAQLVLLSRFFDQAAQANRRLGLYDSARLEDSFRSILLRDVTQLSKDARSRVLKESSLVTSADVRKFLLRQKIKKLIGRG